MSRTEPWGTPHSTFLVVVRKRRFKQIICIYFCEKSLISRMKICKKFHQRGIVISHAVLPCVCLSVCLSVHGYQSRASKKYPFFMIFGIPVHIGRGKTPVENQLDTFIISIDFLQLSILKLVQKYMIKYI